MLLSGVNFLIGLALIRFATKEAYGLYSQLFGVSILTASLLEALIGSVLTTLVIRMPVAERSGFVARAFRLQLSASAVFSIACGVSLWGLSLWTASSESPLLLAISFALFIFALSCREFCRTALFAQSRPDRVILMDLVFVVMTVFAGGAFVWRGHATVVGIVSLLAVTNFLAAVMFGRQLLALAGTGRLWPHYRKDIRTLWSMGRWALIGAVVAWLVNSGYLYFAGGFLGVAALADLNAARLLLIPISLVAVAWSRVARPTIGALVAASDWSKHRHLLVVSTLVMEGFAVTYVGGLLLGFPWLSAHVLGEKYQHVAGLLMLWGVYFAVNSARNVGTTSLASFGAFRALFWQGLLSAVILVMTCLIAIPRFGVQGALAAMIAVEVSELLVNWFYLLPRARQSLLRLG